MADSDAIRKISTIALAGGRAFLCLLVLLKGNENE
jgi:hypothetical protein